jgi:polysaccharide deacetylase family protein (PEP-CTERM system associated)
MRNALTVDVEEWFQVSNFESAIPRSEWERMPSRVVESTRRLLDLFERHGARATCFVLGWVAERQPALVHEIMERGHQVASHGHAHELVWRIGADRFRADLRRASRALETATGSAPRGYRAPSFSIDRRSPWALEVLASEGFAYDSSIYPVRHPRYGMPAFPRVPRRVRAGAGAEILEFPLTTLRVGPSNLGASGGAWLRLLPPWIPRLAFERMNAAGHPAVLYVHPWEVDPDQPRVRISGWRRAAHYTNLDRTEERLASLLSRFSFGPMEEVLRAAPGVREPAVELPV